MKKFDKEQERAIQVFISLHEAEVARKDESGYWLRVPGGVSMSTRVSAMLIAYGLDIRLYPYDDKYMTVLLFP